MSLKQMAAPELWKEIVQTPFLAGFAVIAADPSGLIGAFQESAAVVKSLDAAEDGTARDIMNELKDSEQRSQLQSVIQDMAKKCKPAEASNFAVPSLAEILDAVSRATPEHFDDLAAIIRRTAQSVADAAKEPFSWHRRGGSIRHREAQSGGC